MSLESNEPRPFSRLTFAHTVRDMVHNDLGMPG